MRHTGDYRILNRWGHMCGRDISRHRKADKANVHDNTRRQPGAVDICSLREQLSHRTRNDNPAGTSSSSKPAALPSSVA